MAVPCCFCGCSRHAISDSFAIPTECRAMYPVFIDWKGFKSTYIDRRTAQRAFANAFAHWHRYIDLRLVITGNITTAKASAVWMDNLGPNVLATSNLGDGTCDRGKTQAYSNQALWNEDLLFLVVLHEAGHLLGLPHQPSGVMSAGIQTNLTGLTTHDIDAALDIGYNAREAMPEPPEEELNDAELGRKFRELVEEITL